MNSDSQFWLQWWVQAVAAVGTVSAVLIALFGQAFRAKFFPPQLKLDLAPGVGEATRITLQWNEGGELKTRVEDARFHHLRLQNQRRWSPAQQTQIVLLQIEEPDSSGALISVWAGDVPLGWRHQQVSPPLRTVGAEAYADLCSVVKGKWLQLHLLVVPNNLEAVRRAACRLVLTLQARASEADSNPLRVEIAWDGGWSDGGEEMRRHLVVKTLP